jgi:CubicO group peptidase (beta-lactamase class C family)/uncharacterized membrane protein
MVKAIRAAIAALVLAGIAQAQPVANQGAGSPTASRATASPVPNQPVANPVLAAPIATRGPVPAGMAVTDIATPQFGAYLDGVARSHMTALGVPGLAVTVVKADGTTVSRGYGVAASRDGTPVSIDPERTIMPIASISKSTSMVALMRLVDRGLIKLDDPAQKYLDFPLPTFPGARAITVHDLARHEAGFEERWLATGAGGDEPDPRPWPQIMAETQPRLIAPPGSYPSYSNYGAALIGYIVERVAKRPYADVLNDEVFAPLGMASSSVRDPLPAELQSRQAMGWLVSGGVVRPDKHFFNVRSAPAGRVQTTQADMARYMRMLMTGGRAPDGSQFLSPAAMQMLLFDVKRTHPAMPGMSAIFAEKDIAGIRFIGHGGDGAAHHTDMIVQPALGVGVFIVEFSAPGSQARDQLESALMPVLVPGTSIGLLPMPEATPSLAQYAGQYRHYRWAFTSIERLLGLTQEFAVKDSGKGTLIVASKLGGGEYVPAGAPGLFRHRTMGDYLYMHPDAEGRMLLNFGNYFYVTAYKLDTADTQSFNGMAYWTFVFGLSILGLILLGIAINRLRKRLWGAATGEALLGTALLGSGFAAFYFLAVASSLSEQALQHSIPPIASTLLAIPVIAIMLVVAHIVGWAMRRWPAGSRTVAALRIVGILLFAAFILYLNHWNALGWRFP